MTPLVGYVIEARAAAVPIILLDPSGQTWEIDALVDTGYTDELILPKEAIREMRLPWVRSAKGTTADEREAPFNVYRGRILWFNQIRTIEISDLSDTALVGMQLMEGYRLVVDVADGGAVTLSPIPSREDDSDEE